MGLDELRGRQGEPLCKTDILETICVGDLKEAKGRVANILNVMTESCGNETNIPSLIVEGGGVGRRSEDSHAAVAT